MSNKALNSEREEGRDQEKLILLLALGLLILLKGFSSSGACCPERNVNLEPSPRTAFLLFQPMSINQADQELFCAIPGIGPALSERIINLRKKRGSFSHFDDLLDVEGIGPVKLEKMRQYCCL